MPGFLLRFAIFCSISISRTAASTAALTTRSWNCCKHSCSWPGAANVSKPVTTCDKSNVPLKDYNQPSSCDDPSEGAAYACADQHPWQVDDTTSYGYAAVHLGGADTSKWCCACYELQFNTGVTQSPLRNRTMVVQAVSMTDSVSDTFDLLIPWGGLGDISSCIDQYTTSSSSWGSPTTGLSAVADCDRLAPALQDGCRWRFGWFANAQNPRVVFKHVECPTALTAKTGCSRNDEPQRLASDPPESPISSSPPLPSSRKKASISTNLKIVVAVCVSFLSLVSAIAVYCFWKRRRTNMANRRRTETKAFPEIQPEAQKPELAARSENAESPSQELSPVFLQEVDSRNVHEVTAVVVGELDAFSSTRTVRMSRGRRTIKPNKPLPDLPAELEGSSGWKEHGGDIWNPRR